MQALLSLLVSPRPLAQSPLTRIFVPSSEPRRAASESGLPGKQVDIDPVAALEQQLRAVTLRVPSTPPTTPYRRDRRIGLVYDVCMELHQGPDGAPPPSRRCTRAFCSAMGSSALKSHGSQREASCVFEVFDR